MKNSTITRATHNPFSECSIFNHNNSLNIPPKQVRDIEEYITKIVDKYSFSSIMDSVNNMCTAPEEITELEKYLKDNEFSYEYDIDITNFIPITLLLKKDKCSINVIFASKDLLEINKYIFYYKNEKEGIENNYSNIWDKQIIPARFSSNVYSGRNTMTLGSIEKDLIDYSFNDDLERVEHNFLLIRILKEKLTSDKESNNSDNIQEGVSILNEMIEAYKKFYRIINDMKNKMKKILDELNYL